MQEGQHIDKKSLRALTKPSPDWDEFAKDAVAFANAQGGTILFGIEDSDVMPPAEQRVPCDLSARLQREVQTRTMNVTVVPALRTAENGGEYIELQVPANPNAIAGTSNGRYYIRVDDSCQPVLPDDLLRLVTEKAAFVWELQAVKGTSRADMDPAKVERFVAGIRASDRVKQSVKAKSDDELLAHYLFLKDGQLTNLGAVWVGRPAVRAALQNGPVVHFIKYDEEGRKVRKLSWDDHAMNPHDLLEAVWTEIPEWQEGIDIQDGVYFKRVLNYEEVVVRELVANALVHRPYTMRGDIYINLHPDRLEIHNPGRLPIGVTPKNILHVTVQRNPHLARVFHDLKLMEREGYGYDRIYEALLSNGKALPIPSEGNDRVSVLVKKHIVNESVLRFLEEMVQTYELRAKEIICLGLVAQHTGMNATEIMRTLGLGSEDTVLEWIGRLKDLGILRRKGRAHGGTYSVEPRLLKESNFGGRTTLRNIEPHRLKELIREDVATYGPCRIGQIHQRIGLEIPRGEVQEALWVLREEGVLLMSGTRKGAKYVLGPSHKSAS